MRDDDSKNAAWTVLARLRSVLNDAQNQVDEARRSAEEACEMCQYLLSQPEAPQSPDEARSNGYQVALREAHENATKELGRAESILARAQDLRQRTFLSAQSDRSDQCGSVEGNLQRGDCRTSQMDKCHEVKKGTKDGELVKKNVVARCGRPMCSKAIVRKTSERARSVPCIRASSPGVHWLVHCRLGAQDSLRQSYGRLEDAWEQARKLPLCPGRERFLSQMSLCRSVDEPLFLSAMQPAGTRYSYSTVRELQVHDQLVSKMRHILLDRFLTDLCLEHVLPLLTCSSEQAGPDFAAVLTCFFGVVCNGGRRFPAFVRIED